MLCRASAAANLDLPVLGDPQHSARIPAGMEGYVDMAHLEKIRAHDPKLAAELVGGGDVPQNVA